MRRLLLAAAALALVAGPALAQGNAPYNASGSQAGGPRAGLERAAEGRAAERGAMPGAMAPRKAMAAQRISRKRRTTRKLGGGPL